MKRFAVSLILGIFFLFISTSFIYADNLLLNSSFEDVSSGVPNNWTKNVSTATIGISTTTKIGTASASINKTNSTTGSIYLYQDVDVEPNSYYSILSWVVKNDSKFSYAILRISWRDSSQEVSKTDSSQLTSDSSTFQELKINSVQAPSGVVKARIELLANISSPNPSNPVLFDDVNFSQVSAPEQPASTPSPTPTPTLSPSPTPTSSPTPSPTATPTPKPTTPKPTPTIVATSTTSPQSTLAENETGLPGILGAKDTNANSSPIPFPGGKESTSSGSILDSILHGPPVAFVFVVVGLFFLGFAGYGLLKHKADTINFIDENT